MRQQEGGITLLAFKVADPDPGSDPDSGSDPDNK